MIILPCFFHASDAKTGLNEDHLISDQSPKIDRKSEAHPKECYPLLITGCARSGSGYIAKVLDQCGIEFGHEWIKKDGMSSWLFVADSGPQPWGTNLDSIEFKHIFHQVRHPLAVISSVFTTESESTWNYVCAHIPEISQKDSRTVKSAKYWYYWNLKAEKKAEWTYRIEDFENVFEEFSRRSGFSLNIDILQKIPKNMNTRGKHFFDFTWDLLKKELDPTLYENIRTLARHYGYILED